MGYNVIGSEVNLAARLEQNGEPDGVMMSYETYTLIKEELETEEGPPLSAKGVSREVRCFMLRGIEDPASAGQPALNQHYPGLRLSADLEKMSADQRERAVADLQKAIEAIRRQT